jgi:hypothetical protein
MVIIQSVFTIMHIILGLSMFYAVITLEQRSFIQTLWAETKEDEDLPQVEQIDPEKLIAQVENGTEGH